MEYPAKRSGAGWGVGFCSDGGGVWVGVQGDLLAGEAFKLTDEVALVMHGVGGRWVVVGIEVVVAGPGIRQGTPDDGEHGVARRDDRSVGASSFV